MESYAGESDAGDLHRAGVSMPVPFPFATVNGAGSLPLERREEPT